MKKVFKKILLLMTIISVVVLTTFTLDASSIPASFKLDSERFSLPVYIDGYNFDGATSQGSAVYCLDYKKPSPRGQVVYYHSQKDAGFAYLLENGYPRKNITGDNQKDFYITQMAIWIYMDTSMGTSNVGGYYAVASDPSKLKPYIDKLVAGAMKQKSKGYENPTVKISYSSNRLETNGDYFTSSAVSVSGTKLKGKYSVSLTNAPSGTKVIDKNGNSKNSFNYDEKFYISVPRENVKDLTSSIDIKVSATGQIMKAYEYRPKDNSYQNTMTSVLYPEDKNVSETAKFYIKTSKVSIVKIDKNTKKALPGATLALYDENNKEVAKWVSNDKYITFNNLKDGRYYVKELIAPEGYHLNEELFEFIITDGNRDIKLEIANKAKTSVITIIKIDSETKKVLPGAKFVIKDGLGKIVKEFTTTNKPYVITDLLDGVYTIYEVKAPEGYVKSDEVYEFVINEENNSYQLTFENTPVEEEVVEVPPTSAFSNIMFTLIGISILLSTVVYVKKHEIQ